MSWKTGGNYFRQTEKNPSHLFKPGLNVPCQHELTNQTETDQMKTTNRVKYAYDHNTNDYVAWDCVTGKTVATGATASECLGKCDLSGGKPMMTTSLSKGRINPRDLPYSGPKGLEGNAPHSAPKIGECFRVFRNSVFVGFIQKNQIPQWAGSECTIQAF